MACCRTKKSKSGSCRWNARNPVRQVTYASTMAISSSCERRKFVPSNKIGFMLSAERSWMTVHGDGQYHLGSVLQLDARLIGNHHRMGRALPGFQRNTRHSKSATVAAAQQPTMQSIGGTVGLWIGCISESVIAGMVDSGPWIHEGAHPAAAHRLRSARCISAIN